MQRKSGSATNSLPLEERPFFCAVHSASGPHSRRSDKLEDLLLLTEQASIAWVDIKVNDFDKDSADVAAKFDFQESLVSQLMRRLTDSLHFQGGYADLDTELGLLFPAIGVEGLDITVDPLLVLLRRGLVLTVRSRQTHIFHNLHRYADTFLGKLPQNLQPVDWLTLMLVRIIGENNERNFERLQEIDRGSESMTEELRGKSVAQNDVGDQIYRMKRALVKYLSCLWATSDTLSSLHYGDSSLISDEAQVLDKIANMTTEVRDQLSLAEHLSEVLASGLESLQSIENSQLQDQSNLLQEKNNQLADLNNTLQEKNNLLQDKNNKLQEYNNQLQEKNNMLQDYNNQLTLLNNRLTALNNRITLLGGVLAIISAGFVVPNTIATVMSQTNIFLLNPRDMWWYLTLIIGSTVFTTALVWSWVKKKGFLPKTEEASQEPPIANAERKVMRSSDMDADKK